MNRRLFFIAILIAAVVTGATAFAQQQPHRLYNEIMKDVAATFPNLKKNLDAMNAAGAAEDAAKLQKFFAETEAFWAPLNTQDAVRISKRAQQAAEAIGTAAKANDMKAATASYANLQRTCGGCHSAHRDEITGGGYTIKP
jgi:cytochrome c556